MVPLHFFGFHIPNGDLFFLEFVRCIQWLLIWTFPRFWQFNNINNSSIWVTLPSSTVFWPSEFNLDLDRQHSNFYSRCDSPNFFRIVCLLCKYCKAFYRLVIWNWKKICQHLVYLETNQSNFHICAFKTESSQKFVLYSPS